MKKIFIPAAVLISVVLSAQDNRGKVGINTADPKTTLDINGIGGITDTAGLQAPRLTRQELTNKGNTLYGQDQVGALIYITDITGGNANASSPRKNITGLGYYYFDGTEWKTFSIGAGTPTVTADNGLTKTVDNIQLGGALNKATTISNISTANKLSFTATGIDAINFDTNTLSVDANNDRVGIGTNAPSQKLEVIGNGKVSEKMLVGPTDWTSGGALVVRNLTTSADPLASFVSSGNFIRATLTDAGSLGIGISVPDQRIDVNGNVKFRSVPSNAVNSTDKVLMLTSDGTGNLAKVSDLVNITANNGLTKTTDNIKLGGTLTENTTVNTTTDGYSLSFAGSGNIGIGNTGGPTQKLDVAGGNVRFRGVPNETTLTSTDRIMALDTDGVGKKISVNNLQNLIDTNTNLYTDDGTLAGNRVVTLGGNNLKFNGVGNLGINLGTFAPTQKLDIDGTIRLRDVKNGSADDDSILVIDNTGVVKKSNLPPTSSFVLYDTNSNTITRNAVQQLYPLAFEGVPNKIYTDYIQKVNNTTYRVKKRGVYSVEVLVQFEDIPEASDGTRTGCRAQLSTGAKNLQVIGDRWLGGAGTTSISRSVILNVDDEISVGTGCTRNSGTYKTSSGSTIFITYMPL